MDACGLVFVLWINLRLLFLIIKASHTVALLRKLTTELIIDENSLLSCESLNETLIHTLLL